MTTTSIHETTNHAIFSLQMLLCIPIPFFQWILVGIASMISLCVLGLATWSTFKQIGKQVIPFFHFSYVIMELPIRALISPQFTTLVTNIPSTNNCSIVFLIVSNGFSDPLPRENGVPIKIETVHFLFGIMIIYSFIHLMRHRTWQERRPSCGTYLKFHDYRFFTARRWFARIDRRGSYYNDDHLVGWFCHYRIMYL